MRGPHSRTLGELPSAVDYGSRTVVITLPAANARLPRRLTRARNAGKVCTRRMILENVWGPGYSSEFQYLKVYAYRIRRKLGDGSGSFLQSDPSVGYRLVPPPGA